MSDRSFHIIKPKDNEPEHKAICSIDGEPWPCRHQRVESHQAFRQRWDVLCSACGKRRNACASLDIQRALDGRAVYFHWRKRCRPNAKQWWDENVLPHTGEAFREGQWIDDLARYIGARQKLSVVNDAKRPA